MVDGPVPPGLGESIRKITWSKLVFYITHEHWDIVMWGVWRFQGEWLVLEQCFTKPWGVKDLTEVALRSVKNHMVVCDSRICVEVVLV